MDVKSPKRMKIYRLTPCPSLPLKMLRRNRQNIARAITDANKIPENFIPVLRERLPVVCGMSDTQPLQRVNGQRRPSLSRQRYTQRKAYEGYQYVLKHRPGIFLIYILCISPRYCIEGGMNRLAAISTPDWPEQYLNDGIQAQLNELGLELQLFDTTEFKGMMDKLRQPPKTPADRLPRPPTAALDRTGGKCRQLICSRLGSLREFVGSWLCEAVVAGDDSSTGTGMVAGVRASVPLREESDVVLWIEIGRASEVARRLFPNSSAMIREQERTYSIADGGSDPCFYLSGASVSALREACPHLHRGVSMSQLWKWEIENGVEDTTDCVIMRKNIAKPDRGLLRLQMGFFGIMYEINSCFAAP